MQVTPIAPIPATIFDEDDAADIGVVIRGIQNYYGQDAIVHLQSDGNTVNVTVFKYGRIVAAGVY